MTFPFSYIKPGRKPDCCLYICHARGEAEERSEQWTFQKEQKEDTSTLTLIFKPLNLGKGITVEIVLDDFQEGSILFYCS